MFAAIAGLALAIKPSCAKSPDFAPLHNPDSEFYDEKNH